MSPELISIITLGVMFVVATVLPINIGILAFVATFLVGTTVLGLGEEQIVEGFPVDLFITIVGVTYLFAIARLNGTVDLLVRGGVRLVGGRLALVPWVLFGVAAVLTALGTFTPAAVALLVPIGMSMAFRHGLSPLMIGMMIISGAHAGAFSPIAVSGALVLGMVAGTGLSVPPAALFLASFGFNVALSLVTYLLLRRRASVEAVTEVREALPAGAGPGGVATLDRPTTGGGDDGGDDAEHGPLTWQQKATLAALVGLVVGALGFHLEIGFLALAAGALLGLASPALQTKAIEGISWPTILLVAGMVTYVGILEQAGAIDWVSHAAMNLGTPLLVALVLCVTVAVTSAFASSTAILTALIPIAVPLLLQGSLPATGLIAAMAISTTIVDVSPFSTNGALVLANARGVDRNRFYRQVISYTVGIVGLGPVVAWAVLVLPGVLG